MKLFCVATIILSFSFMMNGQSLIVKSHPLDKETVITDLSDPEGSGKMLISVNVDYKNGTDSTLYFVGNSPEAAFRTLGIGVAQITNMTNITDEKYIREMLLYFTDRFPKVNLWVSVSAEVPCSE